MSNEEEQNQPFDVEFKLGFFVDAENKQVSVVCTLNGVIVMGLPIRKELDDKRKDEIARLVMALTSECIRGEGTSIMYTAPGCGIGKEN